MKAGLGLAGPLILCAALAGLYPAVLRCQDPMGELRLEVKDPSGAPMEASGKLESFRTGVDRVFRSDAHGRYIFEKLPRGRYRLEVSSDGFATQSSLVDVQSEAPMWRTVTMALAPAPTSTVTVVGTTALPGVDLLLGEAPAPIQTADQLEIERSGALDLSDFLNRRLNGVYLNEVQGNPFQADLNYRGYTASPLLGTPQGLSIYMDGVRLNQPFGDVVSWDLIPRIAIAEVTLMPGSNPLFGLNTLGGALSIQTKDGHSQPGTTLQLSGGSFARKAAEFEHGGSNSKGLSWYLASSLFFEDGWRDDSPSNVRQFFGKLGWQHATTYIGIGLSFANNALTGNGLQEKRFLDRNYSSVYTKPDITGNRSPFVNLTARHSPNNRLTFFGNGYYRYIRTNALNGDINDNSLDQAVYQPGAAERAALAAGGYTGFPTSGETAANTPFPSWRCIAQALLRDEPAEKCNGLINRSKTKQHNYGFSGQATLFGSPGGRRNQLTIGAAYDRSKVDFAQSAQLGFLNPDRSVTGVNSFADEVTGGDEDRVPFDTRVDLNGRIHTGSLFATDTLSIGVWNLTLSGRYNRTHVDNDDRISPISGPGSLTSRNVFDRFNPAAGFTFRTISAVNAYFGYSEGNRAPSSIELGCADPQQPCKLPNAMTGDPPLEQVVTRTLEAGLRGGGPESKVNWSAGWFRADNRNDILFVASAQSGFGYFKNFGRTLRQGVEAQLNGRIWRATLGGGYTYLDATFQSPEEVNGAGNSANEKAQDGVKGVDGVIEINPGNQIPLSPKHMLKTYADIQFTQKFLLDAGMVAVSRSFARGNENNLHEPDGQYYLGSGKSSGYAVLNLGARYQVHRSLQLFVQMNNLLDRRYYSASQLGATGFTDAGAFAARPLPAIGGVFPVRQATFYAPGAPRGAWAGLRLKF